MNTTIDDIKNEVAKKHNYKSWEQLNYTFFCNWASAKGGDMIIVRQQYKEFESEAMILYHQRLCEEAGKEINDEKISDAIQNGEFNDDGRFNENFDHQRAVKYVKDYISTLIASKQVEIERLENEIDEFKKQMNDVGVFNREDVSPEFLKTINSIEENLKRKPNK